jgi:hypothetical protein
LKSAIIQAVKEKTNLYRAYLQGAYLQGADLRGTYLQGADLRGATGINKYLTTPLYMLLDQVGPIRAYKLVKENHEGPYNGGIIYHVDKHYKVNNANKDEACQCGSGISLATLDWCIKEWRSGYKILIAEFYAENIACIPINSDGKFRVHECDIVDIVDLKKIGLEN